MQLLFYSEEFLAKRDELGRAAAGPNADEERAIRELLAHDPSNFYGLLALGRVLAGSGRGAEAAVVLRQGLDLHPYAPDFYFALADVSANDADSLAFAVGLSELGIEKSRLAELHGRSSPEAGSSGDVRRLEALARALRGSGAGANDPVLHRHHLIHQLVADADGGIPRPFIGSIVSEGAAIVPLLIGVLRGWADDRLPVPGDEPARTALLLLGEIGDPAAIAPACQLILVKEEDVASVASWSLWRLVSSGGALAEIKRFLSAASADERSVLASFVAALPEGAPARAALSQLPLPSGALDADSASALSAMTLEQLIRIASAPDESAASGAMLGLSGTPRLGEEFPIPECKKRRLIDRALGKHYQGWPDEPLPALGGKTARAAIKTAGGRRAVEELIGTIERGENGKRERGEPWYDMNRVRASLGLPVVERS